MTSNRGEDRAVQQSGPCDPGHRACAWQAGVQQRLLSLRVVAASDLENVYIWGLRHGSVQWFSTLATLLQIPQYSSSCYRHLPITKLLSGCYFVTRILLLLRIVV